MTDTRTLIQALRNMAGYREHAVEARDSLVQAAERLAAQEAEIVRLKGVEETFRVMRDERYGGIAQWQNEAEINRQAWLQANAEIVRLTAELADVTAGRDRRSSGEGDDRRVR